MTDKEKKLQAEAIDYYRKQIAELEETNNELKGKLVLNDMVLTDKTKRIKKLEDKLTEKVTLESLDIVSGKIKQLEKENAELKESLKKWKDAIYADVENYNDQLTRAKELLKEFNLVLKERGLYHNGLYKRTEQFLSEVEK